MARFVKFPGTAGSYASTDDVNILTSADEAHIVQGIGSWVAPFASAGKNVRRVVDVDSPFGGSALGFDSSTNAGEVAIRMTQTVVAVEQTWIVSVKTDLPNVTKVQLDISGVKYDLNGIPGPSGYTICSATFTPFASAAVSMSILGSGFTADISSYAAAICLRTDAVAAFVPSLRIVGTLFEAFNATPTNPPIAFAADGTPLTVGVSWAGDLFTYSRHDGADASAPIVASFDADDIPIP